MAHTLSNESLKRAEEYKKQRIMSGTPEVRAANIASTKRAGVEAARRANTPAVKKTQEASSGFKLSESSLARARAYVGNRDKDKNTGAYNAEPTNEQSSYELDLTPYKTYHQPYGAAGGTGKQSTKAYSEHRLQQEAYDIYAEYGGKSYSEIQKAIAQNTGDDYMTQYRNQVLTQIGQQNRTRDDIEREIAETDAELKIAQAEWDAYAEETGYSATGDSREGYQQYVNRVNELTGQKEALEGELWMWDQGEIYSAVPGYSDYKKNSAINPENGEWDDPVYRYINNIQRDGTVASENRMAAYEYMTPEEVGIYNYLYNVSGREAAEKYLEYLDFSLNNKRQREVFENAYDFADKNFGTKTAASLASIPANLLSGAGYLDVLGQRLNRVVTGSDKPIDYSRGAQTAYNFAQGAREGTMSGMSDTGKFIYSTAMSMGDSLGVLGISLLTGGSGATMLLGGSAATSTMHEAKANGASDGQALAMGFVAGAAETIMEKLPLEQLLNISSASNFREIVRNIIKQGANEATEEVLTTLVNTAADVLIMGDKNALMRSYEKYLAQGYTPEEAERLAKNEWWQGLAGDALGGFLSGGMFGAGGTAVKGINQYSDRTERGKGISASEHTLPLLIDHVEKGYTNELTGETMQYSEETKKTAAEIKGDLSEGKKISNAKKGKLAEQVLKDNAEFNEKVLPRILLEAQNREDAAAAQKDETSSEKNEMSSKEAAPKRNVVQTIRDRLQKRADAKAGANNVDPAAAKILAQEVLNDESTYSKKTRAAAEKIINGETVNNADSQALVKGIKADNADFSGYTAEEIIAEASVLAQEEVPQSTGTETTAEIKTAVPQSTAQQTTTEGAMTNDQGTDGTRNEQRSTEGGTTYSDRGRGRFSETYSGDAAPVGSQNRNVGAAKSRAQTAGERQNKVADLRIEPTSAASVGINGGSEDATMYIIPEEAYDEELRSIAADAKANGVTVHFFTGVMPVNNSYANASVSGNEMYIRADSAKYTAAELYDHEKFHKIFRGKPGLITELYIWIRNNYTAESFDDIIDTYYDKYNDVYGLDEMSANEALRIVLEEMFADAYAGTNKFGTGATEYTAPTRAAADAMGATPSEYNANQGRAPPQGMTYDDVKQAVREVLGETGAQNQLQGVEQISDAKNQQGLDMRQEVMFSISKDSLYMDNAIKMNESKKNVDAEDMNEAKVLRAKVAARMIEIKDRGLVGLPEDKEGNTFISNSSYGGTEENTTVCPRSLAAEAFVDAVSEYLGRPLTIQEQIYISQDLQGRSLTPECTYCYVATDRKAYRAFLGEYIAQRDAVIEKLRENPDIDVTALRADHQKLKNDANATVSPIGQIYKEFLNGRKVTDSMYDRFKMWVDTYKSGAPMVEASHLANIDKLMGDIRSEFGAELKPQISDAMKYAQSASWAKKRVSYVAYNGHILKWKQDRINKLNSHYGLRMYSFSDFHPAFVLENMQMLTDAAVRGLKVLGYTKDTDFVEIFAPTGMNINISTFGGIMDGVVFENDRIGASWAKAQELRNKYPNVGITFVATNDAMVEWALNQDWVDVVIPYHLVRTGTEIAKAFGYTNYTAESADTKRSDWEKGFEKSISPTEHNNDKETYLKALEKNRLEPRFKRYLENDNYMKLVNECRQPASLSEPVKPVFNEDAAMKALAKLEANGYYQPIGGSVDRMYEIAAELGEELSSRPQQMFSLDDEGYDTTKLHWAYESGIIDKTDGAAFWHTIANIQKRGYSVPRSMSGEYIISSKRKLMFTDADYYAPTLTRVIVFGDTDSTNAESAKELNIGAETGIYNYEESRQLIEIYYGEQYISEYRYRDFGTDEGENGQRQGRNSGGVASATGKRRTGGVGSKFAISDEVDADGNSLTIDQQEYFAESKARDDAGNLLVMYHGSQDAGFHIFDNSFSDDKTSFFFTDRNDVASTYSGTRKTYEAKTLKTLDDINEYLADVDEDETFVAKYGEEYALKLPDGYVVARSDSLQGILDEYFAWAGVIPGESEANYKVYLNLTNPLVVDAEGRNWDNVSTEFYPELYEQWRNGFTEEEKAALIDLAGWEDYNTFKTEVQRAVRDAAKPTADEYTKALNSAYWKNSDMSSLFSMASDNFSDDVLRAEAIRQMNTRDYAQRAKERGYDGVIFKNVVDNGVYGATGASTVAIAFNSNQIKSVANKTPTTNPDIRFAVSDEYDVAPEDRTWEDTGDRKFNSYAFDHPELRPYFKEAARAMFYDLLNSAKGERWSTTSDSKNWTGSKRNTTENIARLLDNGHMTYKRIQEALLTMLDKAEDGKAMNRADVKKVELELDAMLQEGYTDPTGLEVEPNREYRRLLDAIKSGYSSVEEADAAYEAEMRDEAYEAQVEADVWEGYDQRADEMYDDVYSAYEPDVEAYEDISQEDRDYLGEIVESADELRLQRMADEKLRAAEELDEENEALRLRNMEYAEEANNYFDAYNYEELENERRRMDAVMQNALQNPDISAAPDTSAEHWESITAQLIEEKRRQKRENAVAEAENNDMYLPDGVSDAEILAAQEKYREQMAARKAADEAKYEGLTAEEAEAAKEADARRAQAEYLEGVDRKNFVGSDAMEKLKIKISRSIANYKSSAGLIERAKANAALVREMDRAIQKMHPSEEEKYFATGIMNNDLSEYSIPMHLDAERVLELADYMVARKAGRTDLFAAQKADINNRNRQLASDKFKNAEKAKRVSLTRLNYMTPRRAMIEMFGQEQGEEIYRTFFAPVRTNDAERIRFAERLRQEALEIAGADGKKGKLTKEERALTQMLMEGKAAGEMLAKMETGGKERIEAAAKRILKGEPLREENGKYVVGEEGADELSAKEAEIARRHAAYTQAQEAIRTGTFDKKKVDGTRITNAAKHFAQQYDMLYEAINEFLVAHGEEPIGFIKGYAPHLQAEDAMKPLERLLGWMGAPTDITDLRAEIAGETHNRKPNRKWNPHFLSRTVGSETEYDVYKGFEEYVDYISEVFYHMDDIMRLRAASRYLRTAYTTEDSKNQLRQIEEVRNGGYYEKMNFLLANNRIARGETLIGAEIDEALDKYIDEILNEEENKTAVSSSLVMWLDNYTNLLAGKQNAMDRGLEQQIGRKGIRAVNKAVNRLISAQVVGNISSALNQMAQMPMTITELGADNVSKALWDLVRHSGEMRRWSTENDFLTARKGTTILNYQITDKLTNGLAKPLELADWLMSAVTARAAYHQALKQGMDVENAMDYSVQKSEDIMGSRNKASKPVAFSTKNPIMRLVNAYQIEVLNQWQHVIKDLSREYKSIAQSRGKWAAAGRIAKDLVLYLILAALINRIAEETYGGTPAPLDLLGIVGNLAASGNGLTLNEGIVRVFNKMVGRELLPENHTFDSEMPDEFDWGAAWEDTAYTLSSEIPFLNNILAAAGLTDDKTVFAAGVTDAIESGKKAADHFFVTRTEREEGKQESAEVLDGLYDVAMGISEFILGGRQLQKTIQGVTTVAGHGEKNSSGNLMYPVADTVGNWIKGTLFGKTALENSRAYYASGASPLNSTRNEQYFGMVERGVDEDTAYGIAQGLADVTSDKDEDGNTISGSKFMNQMDFVMNADVPDEVKGFLALSIASDAAYERYEDYDLEASGVDPAAFMLGWAFYQSATGKDKAGQTEAFLRQQGVSTGDIAKIIAALKKK